MNKDLLTILKELKNIQPNAEYAKRSKMLVLTSSQNNNSIEKTLYPKPYTLNPILNWFNLKHSIMVSGAVATLIFIILWTASYLPGNKNGLVAEANEINASIQIKLNEVGYHLNNQVIDSSTAADIQNLLKETVGELTKAQEELNSDQNKLKEVVEKIKEAEKNIAEINKLLQE